MTTELAEKGGVDAKTIEAVLLGGDLSKLSEAQRVSYYKSVCESVGLNPLTKPFGYIQLNGKLTLYALRDCTDQIRNLKGVSVTKLESKSEGGLYIVTAYGQDKTGRIDASTGAVDTTNLGGEKKANAIMKAETKAKRRLTLSLCGLGWLDESEVDSIPGARVVESHQTETTSEPEKPMKQANPASTDPTEDDAAIMDWATKLQESENLPALNKVGVEMAASKISDHAKEQLRKVYTTRKAQLKILADRARENDPTGGTGV